MTGEQGGGKSGNQMSAILRCERHGSELGERLQGGHAHRRMMGAGGEIGLGKWGGLEEGKGPPEWERG